MKYIQYTLSSLIIATFVLVGALFLSKNTQIASASLVSPQISTTTSQLWTGAGHNLKSGQGTLGSFVLGNATAVGTITFYDATSTDTGILFGTTTLGVINTGATSNTYVFDSSFTRGLLVVVSGALATSTITYQ